MAIGAPKFVPNAVVQFGGLNHYAIQVEQNGGKRVRSSHQAQHVLEASPCGQVDKHPFSSRQISHTIPNGKGLADETRSTVERSATTELWVFGYLKQGTLAEYKAMAKAHSAVLLYADMGGVFFFGRTANFCRCCMSLLDRLCRWLKKNGKSLLLLWEATNTLSCGAHSRQTV